MSKFFGEAQQYARMMFLPDEAPRPVPIRADYVSGAYVLGRSPKGMRAVVLVFSDGSECELSAEARAAS